MTTNEYFLKVNKSWYKQCGETPNYSIEQNLLKIIDERQILTPSVEKSFLIDPLTINNAIYTDSLTLRPV